MPAILQQEASSTQVALLKVRQVPEAVVLPRESMRQVTGQLQQLLGAEVQGYMISPSRQLVRKVPPKLVVTNTLQCACAGIPTAESRKTRRINEPIRF